MSTETLMKATHVYVGAQRCGCRVAVVVDEGTKATAKDVADFIKNGLTVTRESFASYRASVPWPRCDACKALRQKAIEKAEAKKSKQLF